MRLGLPKTVACNNTQKYAGEFEKRTSKSKRLLFLRKE